MRIVDLMSSDIWSDADITARTEALLRSQWSMQAQTILSRKALGVALGQFSLSSEEEAELAAFAEAGLSARLAGEQALSDMTLLRETLALEQCVIRLSRLPIKPTYDKKSTVTNESQFALDSGERLAAQQSLDHASNLAQALLAKRLKAFHDYQNVASSR